MQHASKDIQTRQNTSHYKWIASRTKHDGHMGAWTHCDGFTQTSERRGMRLMIAMGEVKSRNIHAAINET